MPSDELPDELFAEFRAMIGRAAGVHVPETKRALVASRLRRRMRALGIGSFGAYREWLGSPKGRGEWPLFVDALTTHETYFFRDPHHFRWLAEEWVPELAEEARGGRRPRRLAIWSAACSTGEEVYSTLIALDRARDRLPGWSVDVLGTDVSRAALDAARRGSYRDRALRLVDDATRTRYFDRDDEAGRWAVRADLRRPARFEERNLLDPAGGGPFHLIFLKNVLIYFSDDSKRVAAGRVADALAPGGYLVLGPTEGIAPLLGGLSRRHGWLYRRPSAGGH